MIYLHQISAHLTLLRGIILKNFDIILSNPPFSLKIPFDMEMHFCMYGKPPASNADFAFLQYCIFMLKDNGRAAIILPDGILFREGKEYEIRKKNN